MSELTAEVQCCRTMISRDLGERRGTTLRKVKSAVVGACNRFLFILLAVVRTFHRARRNK